MEIREEWRTPLLTCVLMLAALGFFWLQNNIIIQSSIIAVFCIDFPVIAARFLLPLLCGKAFFSVIDYALGCRSGYYDFSWGTVALYAAMTALYIYWLLHTGEASILIITVFVLLVLLVRWRF